MKYETVKTAVAQGVYAMILEGRDFNVLSTILIDRMLGTTPKPVRSHETFKEYADFAWNVIQNWDTLVFPRKHRILLLHQHRAQQHFGDRRRINSVWEHTNPKQERFIFGRYGHGKNSVILTIAHFVGPQHIKLATPG